MAPFNPFNWWSRSARQEPLDNSKLNGLLAEMAGQAVVANPVKARVVRCSDLYYLQLQTIADNWIYACGYHRGAEGFYNYQFVTARNPWSLVDYSLPEVVAELSNPTLPAQNVARAQKLKAADPPRIDEVLSVSNLQADTYRPWLANELRTSQALGFDSEKGSTVTPRP